MSSRPIPEDLLPWALTTLGVPEFDTALELALVAGDASNRRYFRLQVADCSYILAEAPPTTEKNTEFLEVQKMLAQGGVRVPALFGADLQRGYLLLEDLGDRQLLAELNEATVDSAYTQALCVLERLAMIPPPTPNWPAYDRALLGEELSRFGQWFVQGLLGYSQNERDLAVWTPFAELMIRNAQEQPRVLVHRDFQSRNLMPQADGSLAVIDFQDAVMGPVTYDLVSLLRDCYIRWPAERVEGWALHYYQRLRTSGQLENVDGEQFLRWFDWMGLQRHLKVLGTFARLYLRDGKQGYLADLPLVACYTEEILQKYAVQEPVFEAFLAWFRATLMPLIAAQPWSVPSWREQPSRP